MYVSPVPAAKAGTMEQRSIETISVTEMMAFQIIFIA
jgi:hypothetical protein